MKNETEYEIRVKKAKERVAYCHEQETKAIHFLAETRKDLKQAREKYETLFLENERREVARIRSEI